MERLVGQKSRCCRSLPGRDHEATAAARAVISIWTENSVRSDWVRAEAGRAKADGKLIPVKTPDVTYADIPLPFGEMHTENLESSELIRAAVVAQLAKPAVEPSAWALLTKGFKYELLTWVAAAAPREGEDRAAVRVVSGLYYCVPV